MRVSISLLVPRGRRARSTNQTKVLFDRGCRLRSARTGRGGFAGVNLCQGRAEKYFSFDTVQRMASSSNPVEVADSVQLRWILGHSDRSAKRLADGSSHVNHALA